MVRNKTSGRKRTRGPVPLKLTHWILSKDCFFSWYWFGLGGFDPNYEFIHIGNSQWGNSLYQCRATADFHPRELPGHWKVVTCQRSPNQGCVKQPQIFLTESSSLLPCKPSGSFWIMTMVFKCILGSKNLIVLFNIYGNMKIECIERNWYNSA